MMQLPQIDMKIGYARKVFNSKKIPVIKDHNGQMSLGLLQTAQSLLK